MTGPQPEQLDPRILQNLPLMRQAKWDEGKIRNYLQTIEHVDPDAYLNAGKPSLGQQFTHGAGLIGRMAVQGVGNMASMPFGLAGAAYQGVTGNQPPALLQGNQGTAAADQLGLPQPQGAGERIASAVGENAVAGMGIGGAPAAVLGGVQGLVGQGAQEAGVGPYGQMAAQAVVAGIPLVAMTGAAAIRSALAGSAARRQAATQSLALLQAGNPSAPASLGQVASGGILGGARTIQGGIRNVPGASATLAANADAQAANLGQRVNAIADRLSPGGASIEGAGMAARTGISDSWLPQFKATKDQLYKRAFALLPTDLRGIPSKTVSLFAEQGSLAARDRPFSENLASPTMKKWGEDLAATLEQNPDGLHFDTLKGFRSRLGEILEGADLIDGATRGDARRLWGALTEDMTPMVAKSPMALQYWNRANTYYAAGIDRLDHVLQPLIDKNTADVAFKSMMSGTRDGAVVLRQTMKSINPAQRGIISSAVLRRMGMATPGAQDAEGSVFSPETYLTNWNKLSPEAKSALYFQSDKTGQTMKDLDILAKAMSVRKQAGKTLFQSSGTAPNTAFWSIVKGLPVALAGAAMGNAPLAALGAAPIASAGLANLTARAFTNPRIIRWMVKQTTIPFGAMGQQLAILAKDSQKWDPESRSIAQDLSSTLGNIDWPTMLTASAVADQTATH